MNSPFPLLQFVEAKEFIRQVGKVKHGMPDAFDEFYPVGGQWLH